MFVFFFFFKQKTAYEIGTGDWSSDVCLPISIAAIAAVPTVLFILLNHEFQKMGKELSMDHRVKDRKSVV